MADQKNRMWAWAAAALVLSMTVSPLDAGQVELRLVVHDDPAVTVDKREREVPITNPVSTERGVVIQKIGVDISCWARNVLLDGQPIFERYHQKKYIDRLPVARRDLKPGEHTLWPGNHKFTVAADGTVSSQDAEILTEKNVVSLKCYPVVVRAYRANPPEGDLPMSMRLAPLPNLTLREATEQEANLKAAAARRGGKTAVRELLPVFEDFAPLTIWLPANTSGKGYWLHPMGLTFHVTSNAVIPGAADGNRLEGVTVKGREISIPLYEFPVTGEAGTRLVTEGVQMMAFDERSAGLTSYTTWFPKTTPYVLRISDLGPAIEIEGGLKPFPHKSFVMDKRDPARGLRRLLAVEMTGRHLTAGTSIQLRIRALDPATAILAKNRADAAANAVRRAQNEQRQRKPGAAKALAAARAALAKLKTASPGDLQQNLAAGAERFARLQAYDGSQWTDLTLKKSKAEVYGIAVPKLADGIYRLRVGVRGKGVPELTSDQWVSLARPRPYSAGLFTPRGRVAFVRGESFWLGLGVIAVEEPVPAGTLVTVVLYDPRGKRLPILSTQTKAKIENRDTLIIRLDSSATLKLAPGVYRVTARVGKINARAMPLRLVEPERETHFLNLMNGKYSAQGALYRAVLRSGKHLEELAEDLAASGYNAFMGMTYDMERVARHNLDLEQLVRERPELGPWESYYQPSHRDRFMDALVRHRILFWEEMITYNDTMHPRNTQILEATERYCTMETASMVHSPAFQGICMYDEVYNSAQQGIPEQLFTSFAKWQEMKYREKHPGLTSARAFKALDRFATLPPGQRDFKDLQTFRTWPEFEDGLWADFSVRGARGAKRAMPSSRNFVMQRFFGANGSNIFPTGTPYSVHTPYEIATCVMYKDGGSGDRPVFAPMQADVLRTRDDLVVTTQLHSFGSPGIYGKHIIRQAIFALGQKTDGFTYFTLPHSPTEPNPHDWRDTISDITKRLTTPYGDLFLASRRGYKKVAVYASRTTDHLAARKPILPRVACEGIWVACIRAGYPADFLYDEHVLAGKAKEYEVLFFPGVYFEEEVPPELLKQLQAFVNAGKLLIVEKGSKLPIEGIVKADSTFDAYDGKADSFPRYIDFESEMVWDQSEEMTRVIKDLLQRKNVLPAAKHDLRVGPDWLRCRQGEYLLIPNFKFTEWTGLYKTRYQAPDQPTIRFPKRPPVCYDVLAMKRHPVKTDGEWMETTLDMRHVPGAILAFLPAAIEGVRLRATATLKGGDTLQYRAAAIDADGKTIDAGIPFEISLLPPAQKPKRERMPVHRIFRAGTPEYAGAYAMPANAAPGEWTLRCRELFSGHVSNARVAVVGPDRRAGLPIVAAKLDERPVWIARKQQLASFLKQGTPQQGRETGKTRTILIVVDIHQRWVKGPAAELAKKLRALGVKAKVVKLPDVLRLPKPWHRMNPEIDGSRLWRGSLVQPGLFVDAPIIIMGRRNDHRLIEAAQRRDLLGEPVSEGFPGPGRALVRWLPAAFSNHFDTVFILANDAAGLREGIEALTRLDQQTEDYPQHPQGKLAQVDPQAPLRDGQPGTPVSTAFRDQAGLRDMVNSLDVDPATGRLLCGTRDYGHNLFCLDRAGKLLWKVFLPEHNVYFARWYDDGKKVVAATGRGYFVFLLDGKTGKVFKKFAATEYPAYHGHWTNGGEGAVDTQVSIVINPAKRQILIGGLTGLMVVDYDGRKAWRHDVAEAIASIPSKVEASGGAGKYRRSVSISSFILSPDGSRVALSQFEKVGTTVIQNNLVDVWAHFPHIFDAATGKVLLKNTEDPGNQTRPAGWRMVWPKGADLPRVRTGDLEAPLLKGGKLDAFEYAPGWRLANGDSLILKPDEAVRRRPDRTVVWRADEGYQWLTWYDRSNARESRLYRCSRAGLLRCFDLSTGKVIWQDQLPFAGVPHPVADGLIVGCSNGLVVRYDQAGKRIWTTRLRDLHKVPGHDYPEYVRAAKRRDVDQTGEFFPIGVDGPDDHRDILRMGLEQLVNGGFEAATGWQLADGKAKLGKPAKAGKAALQLAQGQLVIQPMKQRVIPSATYLLEFFYRVTDPHTRLTVGAMLSSGDKESLTASQFGGRPNEWTFGRLAIKSLANTDRMTIGFEADGGAVSVDQVSLRPVRFPSANLLANEELHMVEPTFVRDYRITYGRIPSELKKKMMGRNRVAAFKQGGTSTAPTFYQEEAFLHNGRLDDVGPRWAYIPDSIGFSVVLSQPAYVSHLVLYLNNSMPDNAYRFISIQANNVETKRQELAALVRGNRRRFVVVHFKPALRTDHIKILPRHRASQDCLTEVELYGPLGGPDMAGKGKQFPDLEHGFPMFMGHPTHVPPRLPEDLLGLYVESPRIRFWGHPPYFSNCTVADGGFTATDTGGAVHEFRLPAPPPPGKRLRPHERRRYEQLNHGRNWKIGSINPTTTPARYAGRLIAGTADGKMHAVADNGTYLWNFSTGGRIYSSPLPDGDDVYFGSDDGKLYKIDVDSGILIWEFTTGGKVRGAPALAGRTVFVPSWDGFLYAVHADSAKLLWKKPIAKYTRCSPAVHQGRVYLGDEQGNLLCFSASDGQALWKQKLDGFISRCPVVTPKGVLFATDQGSLAMIGTDGQEKWRRTLKSRISGQPLATQSQFLVPHEGGLAVLEQTGGTDDQRLQLPKSPGQVISMMPYKKNLFLLAGDVRIQVVNARSFTFQHVVPILWRPKPPEPEKKK